MESASTTRSSAISTQRMISVSTVASASSYGAVAAASKRGLLLHNAPSLTIEARYNRPVRIKWINDLKDGSGHYLPHLLPGDRAVDGDLVAGDVLEDPLVGRRRPPRVVLGRQPVDRRFRSGRRYR